MRWIGVYCAAPLRFVKVEKNLLERTFISLSDKVIIRMSSETLLRTLNTPSGKEMSLQFDKSVEIKTAIRSWTKILCRHLLVKLDMVKPGHMMSLQKTILDVHKEERKKDSYLNNLSLPRQLHSPSGPHLRLLRPFFFSYFSSYGRSFGDIGSDQLLIYFFKICTRALNF